MVYDDVCDTVPGRTDEKKETSASDFLEASNPAYMTTSPVPMSTNQAYGMLTTGSNEDYMTINEACGTPTEVPVVEGSDMTTGAHVSVHQ